MSRSFTEGGRGVSELLSLAQEERRWAGDMSTMVDTDDELDGKTYRGAGVMSTDSLSSSSGASPTQSGGGGGEGGIERQRGWASAFIFLRARFNSVQSHARSLRLPMYVTIILVPRPPSATPIDSAAAPALHSSSLFMLRPGLLSPPRLPILLARDWTPSSTASTSPGRTL